MVREKIFLTGKEKKKTHLTYLASLQRSSYNIVWFQSSSICCSCNISTPPNCFRSGDRGEKRWSRLILRRRLHCLASWLSSAVHKENIKTDNLNTYLTSIVFINIIRTSDLIREKEKTNNQVISDISVEIFIFTKVYIYNISADKTLLLNYFYWHLFYCWSWDCVSDIQTLLQCNFQANVSQNN